MHKHHTTDTHNLTSDDAILDYVMKQSFEDVSLYTKGSYSVPKYDIPLPVQTLEVLRTESEALKIPEDKLKEVKLQEIRAIYLVERGYFKKQQKSDPTTTDTTSTPTTDETSPSERSDFQGALEIFNEIIAHHPNYPSAYNNRAQLNQLYALSLEFHSKHGGAALADHAMTPDDMMRKVKHLRLQALSDLNQSIAILYTLYPLFSPSGAADLQKLLEKQQQLQQAQQQKKEGGEEEEATKTTTPEEQLPQLIIPKVLVNSLTQRALLHKLRGNEKMSFQDFKHASLLGSPLAQKELEEMNPFEVMNKEAVHKLMAEYYASLHQTSLENQSLFQQ